jgi:hypothetical protein
MSWDYEIIESFIPKDKLPDHRKRFLVFENVYISGSKILAPYRSPFSEKLSIDISEYESRLKQKMREEKLNQLVS